MRSIRSSPCSWRRDTRRDFWLQTDYYKSRKSGNAHNDAALLDDLITNIQFTPADATHNTLDNIKLIAETAGDANNRCGSTLPMPANAPRAISTMSSKVRGRRALRAGAGQSSAGSGAGGV